jgi:uncharacterized phage protein gp47/JayE
MAFERPTLATIAERITQDIVGALGLTTPVLRHALSRLFAKAVAGAAHMLHGHLEFLSRQVFPDTSDREFLVRQAALFGLSLNAASFATGDVTFTGTNDTAIDEGTVVVRADGQRYATTALVTIAAGTATVAVTAALAGVDGSCDAGTALALEAVIAGVDSALVVAAGGLTGGSDEETLDSLRERFLARLRQPPHGGSAADYVVWAREVAGVTRAWCYPLEGGAGTVTVRFVRDDDASLIPDAGEVAAVQAHIDAVRPVTAAVTVVAPTAAPIAFTISIVPDTAANRAAVQAELADLLLHDASPGATIRRSRLEVAIGTADGIVDFTLTTPAADVTHTANQIATLGTITWT